MTVEITLTRIINAATRKNLAELHQRCLPEKPGTIDDITHMLNQQHYRVLLAHDGATLAGFCIIRCIADEVEIISLGVDDNHRARGIAKLLLHDCETFCRTRKSAAIFLEVSVTNLPAIALYQLCGFEICGTRKGYYLIDGARVDAHTMKKLLND